MAWFIAAPLVLWHYGRIAPWGIVGTFLMTVPVVLITWLGVLHIAAQALFPPAAALVSMPLQWLTSGLLWLVRWFAALVRPGVIELAIPPWWLVLGTYGALLLALAVSGRLRLDELVEDFRVRRTARRRAMAVWSGTAGILLMTWIAWYAWPQRAGKDFELHLLSVGNGNAMMLLTPAHDAVLFDIGTDRNLDAGELVGRATRALGVRRVGELAISHANFDHCSGLLGALDSLPINALLLSQYTGSADDTTPAVFKALLPSGRPDLVQRVRAGDNLMLGGMPVEVLWPPDDMGAAGWKANDLSLVLRVHAGARTILFTGDIEGRAMRELLAADAAGSIRLASDVLIAPHHGSVVPESAAFYSAVDPQVVLVSSAEDRPKLTGLLDHVLRRDVRWLSTDRGGALNLVIRPDGELRLSTVFRRPRSAEPGGSAEPGQ